MLGAVKILPGKLADSSGDAVIEPALFDPPGVEAASILAGHATRTSQCPQISSEIAAALPQSRRVEVQTMLTAQCAEVDVNRPAEAVPTCEPFRLYTLEIPEGIRNVLKIEANAAFQQTSSFAAPVAEEVPVRPLACLVAIWTA